LGTISLQSAFRIFIRTRITVLLIIYRKEVDPANEPLLYSSYTQIRVLVFPSFLSPESRNVDDALWAIGCIKYDDMHSYISAQETRKPRLFVHASFIEQAKFFHDFSFDITTWKIIEEIKLAYRSSSPITNCRISLLNYSSLRD